MALHENTQVVVSMKTLVCGLCGLAALLGVGVLAFWVVMNATFGGFQQSIDHLRTDVRDAGKEMRVEVAALRSDLNSTDRGGEARIRTAESQLGGHIGELRGDITKLTAQLASVSKSVDSLSGQLLDVQKTIWARQAAVSSGAYKAAIMGAFKDAGAGDNAKVFVVPYDLIPAPNQVPAIQR
jgi:hypothetical protein